MFGPLEQEEGTPPASSRSDQPPRRPLQDVGQRGRPRDKEGDRSPSKGSSTSPAKGSPHQRKKKADRPEKRARFYPVLNKQESPSKVSNISTTSLPPLTINMHNCMYQYPPKQKTKYSQNPPVEGHVGWVMSNQASRTLSSGSSVPPAASRLVASECNTYMSGVREFPFFRCCLVLVV